MMDVALATEDALSEAVGERLISDFASGRLAVSLRLRRNGFGYLKSRLGSFCEIAHRQPVILFTDLDKAECPMMLIQSWTQGVSLPNGLLFRVAVREIESWLLADHDAVIRLFGKKAAGHLPIKPDNADDPKAALIALAVHAPRDIRGAIVADKRAIASQGILYNTELCRFVKETWNPKRARKRSPSLNRAILRIEELSNRVR
jgi:hypothetical protein